MSGIIREHVIKRLTRSSGWSKIRNAKIKACPQCMGCGRTRGLHVHHIIPFHIEPERELDPRNLIVLCGKYCHFTFGHFMYWKSWNSQIVFDANEYQVKKWGRP